MIGRDPQGKRSGVWGVGVVTLLEHSTHENRGRDSVWENRGGARAGRERLRGLETELERVSVREDADSVSKRGNKIKRSQRTQ